MSQSEYVTLKEVAEMLGDSKPTVMRKVLKGEIPSKKLAGDLGAYLVARRDVEELLAKRATELEADLARVNAAKAEVAS